MKRELYLFRNDVIMIICLKAFRAISLNVLDVIILLARFMSKFCMITRFKVYYFPVDVLRATALEK